MGGVCRSVKRGCALKNLSHGQADSQRRGADRGRRGGRPRGLPFLEQLQYVNPVAWYVARSAYQNVWRPVGLASEDGAVVGFATTGEVIEDELVMVPGRT
jgi:hypothetical protein